MNMGPCFSARNFPSSLSPELLEHDIWGCCP
jgi:hypothetical protein